MFELLLLGYGEEVVLNFGRVYDLSYNHNGRYLAESGATLKVYDVKEPFKPHLVVDLTGAIRTKLYFSVVFSSDDRYLVFTGNKEADGEIVVYEVGSWREVTRWRAHNKRIFSLSFSRDGRYLASSSGDGTVKIWEVGRWEEVTTLRGHEGSVYTVSFSPDGKYLASGGRDRTIRIWEVNTWKEVAVLGGHEEKIYVVDFSPDGRYLASGSKDTTVKVWEVGLWKEVVTLQGYDKWLFALSFSPDGRYLAGAGPENTVIVREVGSWRKVAILKGHTHRVASIVFSPDGKYLATGGSLDGTIRIWQIEGWRIVYTFEDMGAIESITFTPDGKYLASGSKDGTVRIWEVSKWKEIKVLYKEDRKSSGEIAISPDGKYLAVQTNNVTVDIWEVKTWKKIYSTQSSGYQETECGGEWFPGVAFSPDCKYFGFIDTDSVETTISVLEVGTWREVASGLPSNTNSDNGYAGFEWVIVRSLTFSPDSRYIAFGTRDGNVGVVEVGKWDSSIRIARGGGVGFYKTIKGRLVNESVIKDDVFWGIEIIGTENGTKIYYTVSYTLPAHEDSVMAVTFSPDGKYLASGGKDNVTKIWEVGTWKKLAVLPNGGEGVKSLAFSPDGRYLAVSGDGINIWEVGRWSYKGCLNKGEGFYSASIAFSPDGKYFLAGSWDGTIHVWNYRDILKKIKRGELSFKGLRDEEKGDSGSSSGEGIVKKITNALLSIGSRIEVVIPYIVGIVLLSGAVVVVIAKRMVKK